MQAQKKTSALSVRNLLGIKELSEEDMRVIFQTAEEFKTVLARPIKKTPALREVTIANLFFENSTRTRVSFELAEKRLSADVINFSAGGSSVSKGETLLDTVNNILAMKVDMIVMRHPNAGAPHFIARRTNVTVVNAGDGAHEHPTQALLDAFTLKEKFGELKGLRVAIIGDVLHSRVAVSNILALKKLGAEVTVCGPATLLPRYISALGARVAYSVDEALRWCDAANVLRIQFERQTASYFPSRREYISLYGINAERLSRIGKPITILHPGPINRGVELAADVADGPASLILEQVLNGVAIRMAVLYLLAGNLS